MDSENASTPRRTERTKRMSFKAIEALNSATSKIRIESSEEEDSADDTKETILDSVLQNNIATTGKDIFSFQKRKKLEYLPSKDLDDGEGSDSSNSEPISMAKTPLKIRKKIRKEIATYVQDLTSEEEPFSASASDYSASDTTESSTSDEDEEEEDSEDSTNSAKQARTVRQKQKVRTPAPQPNKIQRTRRTQKDYVIKTEDYFSNNANKKIKTSNHTLDKLKTPRLSQGQLQSLLANMKLSKHHQSALLKFSKNNRGHFNKWMYILHENFNILLYGLGSKRNTLLEFQKEFLEDLPVLVVNGFFPSLTLKDILDAIIVDILELTENPGNSYEACDLIGQEFTKIPNTHLYLIVHNIEGDMLRNHKSQNILAKLAAIRNIHLVASIDHINAPLIWNHNNLSKFNFTWFDVTSFLPYSVETSFESSMMVQRTGTLALSSLRNVFLSLTTNSKGIYLIIVKHQLKHGGNQYYQGLLFKDLYSACREAFLVSSDLALRAQLTEFVDHKMVKFRRSLDGGEHLVIAIANNLLQQFLTEQESK